MNDDAQQTEADAAFEALSARLKDHLAKFEGETGPDAAALREAVADLLRWVVEVDETELIIESDEG